MALRGWSNRGLAEVAGCAPGTIDNLVSGRTQSVNRIRTAKRICLALDVPLEVFFVSVASSGTSYARNRSSKTGVSRKAQRPRGEVAEPGG
ncbi:helix-turn-helix domain-containing protein [Sinomonas sp. G460-2]|uniref:helix-turn-helix domain-containing protein n=1 Tax=Sinomonas sp. G460-2 TaxID=3393464 RepID=UPI0039F0F29A